MPAAYIPLMLFSLLVLSVPVSCLFFFKSRQRKSGQAEAETQTADIGSAVEANLRGYFSIQFYFIATLFVIFSVAIIFLFAWAILFRGWLAGHTGALAIASMLVFLGVLGIGYAWMNKKGALDRV